MPDERSLVTVDIRSKRGSMADIERFKSRHEEAAMVSLNDGGGVSFQLAVISADAPAAERRVLAWAQECFASPQYAVTIRKVEAA